jgi:hypothetical protein
VLADVIEICSDGSSSSPLLAQLRPNIFTRAQDIQNNSSDSPVVKSESCGVLPIEDALKEAVLVDIDDFMHHEGVVGVGFLPIDLLIFNIDALDAVVTVIAFEFRPQMK